MKDQSPRRKPKLAIVTGAPCSGKTTLIRQRYVSGYEYVDAGNEFLKLCDGERLPFEGNMLKCMKLELMIDTNEAIQTCKDLVTEICIPDDETAFLVDLLIGIFTDCWYEASLDCVDADPRQIEERQAKRSADWQGGAIEDFVSSSSYTDFNLSALLSGAIESRGSDELSDYVEELPEYQHLVERIKTSDTGKFKAPQDGFWMGFQPEEPYRIVELGSIEDVMDMM